MAATGKLKVLLSAYACEPNRGSEPGVGWNWAIEIARLGHEVWVLTRANNRQVIETEIAAGNYPDNLHFLYYDLPAWAKWWKKGGRGVYLYYLFWQWGAYKKAKEVHKETCFDLVHHTTFVSVRQPSFMGKLGIPFIFGPVAGGERAPWRLRKDYSFRGHAKDLLRDVLNFLVKLDPMMRSTFSSARQIIVTSEQTKTLVPKCFHKKTSIQLAIGIETVSRLKKMRDGETAGLRLLYVGRFLYWKGMAPGLRALAEALKSKPDMRLTMIGKGPEEKRWRRLCSSLGISDHVEWISWVPQNELNDIYASHDVLFFPSLHDSGGMVVLEAMSYGLPVICLDLGGPGVMVDMSCGRAIATSGRKADEVINDLTHSILQLSTNLIIYGKLSKGAFLRTKFFYWNHVVNSLYNKFQDGI